MRFRVTRSESRYEYDNEHRCVKESAVITVERNGETPISYTKITKYNYNSAGSVVYKKSYVEGEETTRGAEIEETEYDDKGRVLRTISYNSLDSSSKFYSESVYDGIGRTAAEYDETGENKTEYEYITDTDTVRTHTLPNGSKFSFGHDAENNVTAITQSTDDGEGNSTQTFFTCGEVTKLTSGNNTVLYSYDHKRRKTKVNLNGVDHLENTYIDGVSEDKVRTTYIAREDDEADTLQVTYNKRGDVKKVEYAAVYPATGEPYYDRSYCYDYEYDAKYRVSKIKSGSETVEGYTYDDCDRQTKHIFYGNSHETEYNGLGEAVKEIYKFGDAGSDRIEYTYTYTEDSARELKSVTVDGYTEEYEQDCLGRNK